MVNEPERAAITWKGGFSFWKTWEMDRLSKPEAIEEKWMEEKILVLKLNLTPNIVVKEKMVGICQEKLKYLTVRRS